MTFWNECDRLLADRYRILDICEITAPLKAMAIAKTDVGETKSFAGVTIRKEGEGVLPTGYRILEINEISVPLKAFPMVITEGYCIL